MRTLSGRLVAAAVRLYPASFRRRFADEMLTAFHDHLEAVLLRERGSRLAALRLTAATIIGLLRSLVPAYMRERRRAVPTSDSRRLGTTRMQNFATDARHALRTLRKRPGFTVVAILTLALGIGANTAVFSVLDNVILAPLPYDEPENLVRLYTAFREQPDMIGYSTAPDMIEIRDQVDAFSSVGLMYTYREVGRDLTTDGPPQRIRVLRVSADYFHTYRVTPLVGRTFTRDEERNDVRRVVLSHRLWDAHTGRDPNVVGTSLELDGEAYEVIGVMRPTFTDVVAGDVAAWVPQHLELGSGGNDRNNHYLSAVARLAPGMSQAQAQAQVDAVMSRLESEFPDNNNDQIVRVTPLHTDVVGESKTAIYVLMGAAGLVLLIACLNVANLFLARSITQTKETAIRTALGAGRARVMGQRLAESILVAAAGGLVGSLVAYWGVRLLLAVSPESLARAEEVGFNIGLLSFGIAITILTGLAFGAAPAYRASRVDPKEALHEGSRGNTGGKGSRHARNVLVATQVALAVVLLVGTGILIKSFMALQSVNLGFDARNVATFEVHLPSARYRDSEQRVQFHHALHEKIRAIPGVEGAGATSWLPANGHYHQWSFNYVDDAGERQWVPAMIRVVEGDYFDVLGIPLVAGRTFTQMDRSDTRPVGVISTSLAQAVFGDGDPIGRAFQLNSADYTIVGVVGDVAYEADGTGFEKMYVSHAQFADDRNWALTYVVKTSMPPSQVVEPVRRALATIDPDLVLYKPRPMDAVIGRHLARDQFTLLLMVVFAAVALGLAAVGVYGVLAYTVSQRTHEIGVRMALGAPPGQVRGIVLAQGMTIAGIGMLFGMTAAFGASRVLESIVFGVSTRDPIVFVGVATVLLAVVVAAGWVPARRATRVDPLDALRRE